MGRKITFLKRRESIRKLIFPIRNRPGKFLEKIKKKGNLENLTFLRYSSQNINNLKKKSFFLITFSKHKQRGGIMCQTLHRTRQKRKI